MGIKCPFCGREKQYYDRRCTNCHLPYEVSPGYLRNTNDNDFMDLRGDQELLELLLDVKAKKRYVDLHRNFWSWLK